MNANTTIYFRVLSLRLGACAAAMRARRILQNAGAPPLPYDQIPIEELNDACFEISRGGEHLDRRP